MKKSYVITKIEPDLYKQFKTSCAYYGFSMRTSFIAHMHKIVSRFNYTRQHRSETISKHKKGSKK